MSRLRINAPVEQAQPLLERYALLSRMIDQAEANRQAAITGANTVADGIVLPLVTERDQLRLELEPWWKRVGVTLLKGKRKTVELAGCVIGTKAVRAKLLFTGGAGDDDAALAALKAHRWAKPYIRVTEGVDKTKTKAALEGRHGKQLAELGFKVSDAGDAFVLELAAQEGTVAA